MKLLIVILALAVAAASAGRVPKIVATPKLAVGRVINGAEVEPGTVPYIISLELLGLHFCAGSIISPNWGLTAAHCLEDYPETWVKAAAGVHSRSQLENAQRRQAKKFIIHEKHNGLGPNDIGLVYFEDPFIFTTNRAGVPIVAPVQLESGEYNVNGVGHLYGWGIDNTGVAPRNLQGLEVQIIDYPTCKLATDNHPDLDKTNICTFTPGKTDGACNGDSGGPLMKSNQNGKSSQVGIVSWGWSPCDEVIMPSVYTHVAPHMDWINKNMQA